jgi:hypothetical protein
VAHMHLAPPDPGASQEPAQATTLEPTSQEPAQALEPTSQGPAQATTLEPTSQEPAQALEPTSQGPAQALEPTFQELVQALEHTSQELAQALVLAPALAQAMELAAALDLQDQDMAHLELALDQVQTQQLACQPHRRLLAWSQEQRLTRRRRLPRDTITNCMWQLRRHQIDTY